jgi:threonine dehydratase
VSLSVADIRAAAQRIQGRAVRTPFLFAAAASETSGARVFIKAEVLQRTGSFKFRGAMSRLTLLSAEELRRGVVAFSSGNHAQAVAAAARELGTSAVIVMPADAPALKISNTRGYGAEVVLYDRVKEDRVAIGKQLSRERGLVLVPPFDDYHVMAGQGTVGLEIAEDAGALDVSPELVIVPCSGGGLAAGVATALRGTLPGARVVAAEPENYDDLVRSLANGARVGNVPGALSICDALMSDKPGELTFPILQSLHASAVAVSEAEVLAAMRHAFFELKLVAEPGGAAALASVLSGKVDVKGKTIAVVLSGGNVDATMFQRALASPAS